MFLDGITTANGIVALLGGLVGLIAAGIPLVVTVVKLIKAHKNDALATIWKNIMAMADTAMTTAEASGKSGADKKQMVIDIVKAECKAQGIDADSFIDQLSTYIDQCITFANSLNKK